MPSRAPAIEPSVTSTAPARPGRRRGAPAVGRQSRAAFWLLGVDVMLLALGSGVVATVDSFQATGSNVLVCVLYPVLVVLGAGLRGLYRRRLRLDGFDEVASMLGATALVGMVLLVLALVAGRDETTNTVVRLWGLSAVLLPAGRITAAAVQRHVRRRGLVLEPALIVGAGMIGRHVARRLASHPEYGLRPVGFLDSDPLPSYDAGAPPVLGSPAALAEVAGRHGARHVVIAFSSAPDSEMIHVARETQKLGLDLTIVPRMFDAIGEHAEIDHLGGLPVFGLRQTNPNGPQFAVKHAFDRAGAALLVLLFSPLLATIALSVRLSSPGPVLFRQRRIGRDGRPFDLLKFRSMSTAPVDDEFTLAAGSAPGGVEGRDRRTPVGRLLRRTSLDELPQLFNVLRGEMSLVGPRPERPEFVHLFAREVERYGERHRVRAGITGWAQVHGLRGQTSIADRAEWDNYYIENWSLWLDFKILVMTLLTIFHRSE